MAAPRRVGRRVAIVAGLRTPFCKSGTAYRDLSALDLGRAVVAELLARTEIDPKSIDALTFGCVVPSLQAPNIAREVALSVNLPKSVEAYSENRACATSIQTFTSAADAIALGRSEVAIAGGAESLSDIPMSVSKPLATALLEASRAKQLPGKLRAFRGVKGKDVLPVAPALKEPTTGLLMGESAEKMAKENGISREAQDAFAHRSHSRAAKAWAEGKFDGEVMHLSVPPRYAETVAADNIVRKDSALAGYAGLKPVFDRRYGTITAGNSSPLTDGASALLLMSEERAKAEGRTPLGYLRSCAYAAVDPGWQLLQAPPFAAPVALDRAGVTLADLDLVDMHEAFAAQVLSNLQAFASQKFAEEKLGRAKPLGEVPDDKLNVNGGSIAIGHPFGATGARMITQTLRELGRRNGNLALLTVCAAGGMGAAVVLERS
ncbi:MAG TPA: acetyl-CoA C-acyltransferase FadI [Myxococcales bacterium]|nr:acetyl-CoA C-acyltransferase FadI [Myxococcales bacterium]